MVTTDTKAPEHGEWAVSEQYGMRIHRKPVPYSNQMSYPQRIRSFAEFAVAASTYTRGMKADVIFASSTPLTIAIPGMAAKKWLSAPLVLEIRDLWPEAPIAMGALENPALIWAARRLESAAYRAAAEIVALSPGMAAGIRAVDDTSTPITVVPNMADLEDYAQSTPTDLAAELGVPAGDRPVILYAGTCGRVNNPEYLINIASQLKEHPTRPLFLFLGEGGEEKRIEALTRQLGVLDDNLFIRPPVPKHQLAGITLASTVVCNTVVDHPAMDNNSANKFGDGLAAGRPILINHGGWHADLIAEYGCGLALPHDAPIAAQQLGDFLLDSQAVTAAGQAAARLGREQFSREQGTPRG